MSPIDTARARSTKPVVVARTLAAAGFRMMQTPPHAKHPWRQRYYESATCDQRLIEIWDGHWPAMNWSILTGRDGGIFVLDADGQRGLADLLRLEAEFGALNTWRVRTGRDGGGEHVYLRLPAGDDDVRNQQPLAGTKVDVRGFHGHVLAAASFHKSGRRYEWLPGCAPGEIELATCPPEWWAWLPKKEASSPAARGKAVSPSARRGSSVKRAHDAASYLIGDSPGYGGFQDPIYKNAIRYFLKAGHEAPAAIIMETLRDMIAEAPKGEGRDVSRYMEGNDLPRIVERARDYAKQVKAI